MKAIKFILSLVSVIGAVLNGYGIGVQDTQFMLLGQLVWASSNSGWIVQTMYKKQYSEMVMFISFWAAAVFSIAMVINTL